MRNILVLMSLLFSGLLNANAGEDVLLNEGWTIRSIEFTQKSSDAVPVILPHTWNAEYADGKRHYNRETMVYERKLGVTDTTKRYFLYFEGVNSVADVFVNRKSAGRHCGGYTAFCIEITDLLYAGDNALEVWASNSYRTDVLPISGDFNVFGGIHRPVHLLIKGKDCINPNGTGCATGVMLQQKDVDEKHATLLTDTYVSVQSGCDNLSVVTTLIDADGKEVGSSRVKVEQRKSSTVSSSITIADPMLWNGRKNPYLYEVRTQLVDGENILDEMTVKTGFRYFRVDAETGFYLNGKTYDLHGVNRHDDFKGVGSALNAAQYKRDIQLLDDLGVTALRLAHYPHGESIYDLADKSGIVVWTEIPLCGPGGYMFTGYLRSVEDNAVQCLKELICQKGHHPSVCFWGLFNELLIDDGKTFKEYDNPVPFVKRLDSLCHQLDPTRLTCFATCVEQEHFIGAADLIAWNKYFSWQKAAVQSAEFFDKAHEAAGNVPIGISEYGRGGSPWQHADSKYADSNVIPSSFHPEEYQAICHENYWQTLSQKRYLWWKTVWQFSDMMSCIKDEGDTPGMNDKGLVTYDRKVCKDAYYFYKAQWNTAPMLHLCSARFIERDHAVTDVRVYTTLSNATLYVNGKKISTRKADGLHRVTWQDVTLCEGGNTIEVRSGKDLKENAVWNYNVKR